MSSLFISPARSRQVIAATVAFALVSVFVIRTSDAAFTATAENEDNLFRTATIELDVDNTMPLFGEGPGPGPDASVVEAVDLIPGQEIDGCLDVGYAGPAGLALDEVSFDVAIGDDGDSLAQHLDVAVQRVNNCTDRDVESTVASQNLDALVGAQIGTGWTPSSDGEVESFLFTVTVDDTLDENAMGDTVTGVDLIWSVTTS